MHPARRFGLWIHSVTRQPRRLCPPFCVGDLDGDCEVGINDFLMLIANWGPSP